jgi:hypothetical protein
MGKEGLRACDDLFAKSEENDLSTLLKNDRYRIVYAGIRRKIGVRSSDIRDYKRSSRRR